MAMEYYYSPAARLSRVSPIFFGRRADVFGQIGNLFADECYGALPRARPQASLQLAARLLRENGLEPRPEMFSLSVADIVHAMKGFLCTFAWNIENPDFVTAECVDQVLGVVRTVLDSNAVTAAAAASAEAQHKALADSATATTAATTAAATTDATGGGEKKLTLKRCIDILREQLQLEGSGGMGAVVEAALAALSDDAVTAHCSGLRSLLLKAQYLVREALGYEGD
jgi:hypothetical protein